MWMGIISSSATVMKDMRVIHAVNCQTPVPLTLVTMVGSAAEGVKDYAVLIYLSITLSVTVLQVSLVRPTLYNSFFHERHELLN